VNARMGISTTVRAAHKTRAWLSRARVAAPGRGGLRGRLEELFGRERHRRGVEEAAAESDEWHDEQDLQGVDQVVGDLGCDHVEAKEKCHSEAEDCRRTENGVDADESSGGQAPGELFRVAPRRSNARIGRAMRR